MLRLQRLIPLRRMATSLAHTSLFQSKPHSSPLRRDLLLPSLPLSRSFSTHLSLRKKSRRPVVAAALEVGGVKIAREDVVKEGDPTNNVPDGIYAKIGAQLHRKDDHPLGILKNAIYDYFDTSCGGKFAKFDDLFPIVSVKANFDDVLVPADHVSRSLNDTYYVDAQTVLRCHTSAHQADLLKEGCSHFLVTGDVYRRDSVDSTHYPVFHQMEGVRVFSPDEWVTSGLDATSYVAEDLKRTLEGLARHLFGAVEMRWVDTYFPFTSPSFELEIYFQENWMEVLGCGVTEQEILKNSGKTDNVAWAFGLGLERLAMVLFDIPDIRLFWSSDPRFTTQLEWEGFQRTADRRLEREQGRMDATEDMSEDLSEGEKGDALGEIVQCETPSRKFQRNISDLQIWCDDDNKEKKLYVVLISLHGLVRGENMELGRDSDTGGQVKYVVELARALSKMTGVYRVDLFTRQIASPDVDWSYAEPTEMLTSQSFDMEESGTGESSGAYIIRIPCGPRDQYLRKELLWPHLQEFVDGALAHIVNMSRVLGEQIGDGQPVWPYVIHGHYADAGDVAALLSGALNVPMVLTGHSLGRNKLEQLLKQGRQSREDINTTYKIMRRIEAEELSLDAAELLITSTNQEIEEQWGLYDGFDVKLEKVLRARSRRGVHSHGRYMPRMVVIPPGMDFSSVVQEEAHDVDGDLAVSAEGASPKEVPPIWADVLRFLANPHKPMILALSRPDPKKNITTLLKAFGECRPLRDLANLTLIMGNRDDIEEMSSGNASVLTTVLKLIDKYDLYGLVAYPKHHKQSDVPDIYRLAAKTKGVFINPALVEPFGLTLIEAAAHGLPMVATKNGGPVDINRALNNGLLVDPHDQREIADALLKLVADKNLWNDCRRNGWRNIHLFSWPEHCRTYLTRVAACRMRHPQWQMDTPLDGHLIEDSLHDTLDVHGLSLRLSIDGDKTLVNELERSPSEAVKACVGESQIEVQDQVEKIMSKMKKPVSEPKAVDSSRKTEGAVNESSKYPLLRKRRRLFVIALDCYTELGTPDRKILQAIQEVLKAVRSDPQLANISGFALSTSMPILEVLELLKSGNILVNEFDVLICSSGSEVYYPNTYMCTESDGFFGDPDYASHIDYRWGYEGVKGTIMKLMNSLDGQGDQKSDRSSLTIEEDPKSCNSHCISFFVRDPTKTKLVDDLRQKLRMRGLRCHLMYCRNSTRLQVIPLLASRSQALRYLFVRWGMNVANMFVILGDRGDTDYEEMISGSHKTIIMKGVVEKGSEGIVRTSGGYNPNGSPLVVCTSDGLKAEAILSAVKEVVRTSSSL